jgi:hypothetical protein
MRDANVTMLPKLSNMIDANVEMLGFQVLHASWEYLKIFLTKPEANPTIVCYNASVLKIKIIFF